MSIIIKGMDMPKICELCPFWVMRTDGRWCRTLHKIIDISKDRADDCPLIEIPKGHGRLIDGDIVADMLDSMMVHKTLNNAFDEVLNMPTILESED